MKPYKIAGLNAIGEWEFVGETTSKTREEAKKAADAHCPERWFLRLSIGDRHVAMKEKGKWENIQDSDEWYTPPEYAEAVREVLGAIDLDPASCEVAQRVVRASKFYTKEDNGLLLPWKGRVFNNPPYSKKLLPLFVDKLEEEIQKENVHQAIVLVNNTTETVAIQRLMALAYGASFPKGRIRFLNEDGEPSDKPKKGQMFLYYGYNFRKFFEVFSRFGMVMEAR